MAASVYVETTIPSYLTARPSGHLVTAAHQKVTAEWWRTASTRHRLVASAIVTQEAQPRIARVTESIAFRRVDPSFPANKEKQPLGAPNEGIP